MLNQVNVSGRLARDPETRSVGNGTVTNFTLGVNNSFKDKNGDKKESTAWVRCVAWGMTGEIVADARKGDEIVVAGKLETNSWEDKDGNKREQMQVNCFTAYRVAKRESGGAKKPASAPKSNFDDEIPF